jgi:hypothetical protein
MCGDVVNMLRNKIFGRYSFRIVAGMIVLTFLLLAGVTGAVPVEEWNKTFGGTGYDDAWSVQQTSDGGYILAVRSSICMDCNENILLIKTDANGNEQWNKTFGGASRDRVYSLQVTSDRGYIIAGYTQIAGWENAWLIKADSNGNEQWNKTFGRDEAYAAKQISDGGYILSVTNGSSVWLIKTDSNGNEQWKRTFGGSAPSPDEIFSIQQTLDGGFILAGTTRSFGYGGYGMLMTHLRQI